MNGKWRRISPIGKNVNKSRTQDFAIADSLGGSNFISITYKYF